MLKARLYFWNGLSKYASWREGGIQHVTHAGVRITGIIYAAVLPFVFLNTAFDWLEKNVLSSVNFRSKL